MRKTLKVVAFGGGPADAFIKAAGITDSTQQTAIKTLVNDLNGYGLWSKMKAIYPMVGGTATSHSYNLKDTTKFQITFNGGWTHDSTGALPNGTNAYGDTQLIPSSVLSQNSTHLSYYSRTNSLSGNTIDIGTSTGSLGSSFRTYIIMSFGGVSYSNINSASDIVVNTMTNTSAFVLAYRNNSANFVNQVNSTKQTLTSASGGLTDKSFYIGAFNRNNSADNFSLRQCAFATIGDGLTDAEASNLYTIIQNYQTTLSRQV
jgi:hypothetical protein